MPSEGNFTSQADSASCEPNQTIPTPNPVTTRSETL